MRRASLVVALVALGPGTVAAAPAPQSGPEPGISRELARHRASTLADVVYDVAYRVPAHRDSAITGSVTITVTKSDAAPLVLDFAEPGDVHAVAVDGDAVRFDAGPGHVTVPVPAGRHAIAVDFTAGDAPLNRRDEFLYTLFVPDRAHEALPSFDQPDLKARFRLELTVPAGWTAVANGRVVSSDTSGSAVVHRFAETEPIPTYLFAFAAGRFQVEERERAGRAMRLFHRETDSTRVARNVDAIFDLHATALGWLEEYTGIPYPFGKFDFVAIPSFQYNGMEHPGAILYRASRLFLDESATRNQELGRASLIAHETAHMWFGDLVTMEWFDDVWMKEVFANLMAAKIVNPSFPELDHELRFLLAHYPAAYSVDRTPGTHPIRQELENLSEAGSLYGAIIYEKAPIVMRQLERLTGEEAFREALRAYLDGHRYGNAGWPALVAELDRVTELDVPAWSRVWIEEPGRPEIVVDRSSRGSYDAVYLRPRDPAGEGRVWPQVTTALVLDGPIMPTVPAPPGYSDTVYQRTRIRLASEPVVLPILRPGETLLPNADGLAYGLFHLDATSRDSLLAHLPDLPTPLIRAAAWLDLWEMMLEGDVDPESMLDAAGRVVAGEPDEQLAQQLLGDLTDLFWRYLPGEVRGSEAAGLEALLWRRIGEVETASRKAAYFNAWRSVATTPAAVNRMAGVWRGDLEIEGLPLSEQDRTTLALHLAVREADGWAGILDAQEAAIENPDRRERFRFIRPAVSADLAVRDSFFASLADVGSRAREAWVVTALGYLHHPLRAASSRRYIRPSLELLEEIRATGDIFFPTRWLSATFSGHSSPEAAAIVRDFIEATPDLPPRLLEKLLQEADPLFRAVQLQTLNSRL